MPDLTHAAPLPTAPAPRLTGPSYTAQTLTVAARVLEMQPAASMTRIGLVHVRATALDAITRNLPEVVRTAVRDHVRATMPAPTGTRGTYAAQLRQIAEAV